MDFCFYCGGKPDKQDDTGKWVCNKCEKLRRPETIEVAKEGGGFKKYTEKEFSDAFSPKVSGISVGDFVVAHDEVVERAKGMGYDISERGIVKQYKDTGRPTEQVLVAFPNHTGWIYTHELKPAPKAPIRIASLEPDKVSPKTLKTLRETSDLESKLGHFTGTEQWYKHPLSKLTYTDGIRYLANEAGAYWLIDIVSSYTNKYANVPFQLWRITVKDDDSAVVSMQEDTGQPYLVKQEIPYTDFPLKDFSWYVIDSVMLLKSEY